MPDQWEIEAKEAAPETPEEMRKNAEAFAKLAAQEQTIGESPDDGSEPEVRVITADDLDRAQVTIRALIEEKAELTAKLRRYEAKFGELA